MRDLPQGLIDALATGATTLCWCWRLTTTSGQRMGFTDHDRDLAFDATTFEAAAGFAATEIHEAVGLSVDNLEVSGAISSTRLSERDLAGGLYDNAQVEIFRVDWSAPENRVLMRTGSLGEVRRAGSAFSAEVRGLAHYLQQPKGRVFQYACDADLGDAQCGVALGGSAYRAEAAIAVVSGDRSFSATGLETFAATFFSRGLVTFVDGAAAGQKIEVKAHGIVAGVVRLELWQAPTGPLVPGQRFVVTAGCDKTFATCQVKFANSQNFRGFPHMPGNDFVMSIAGSSGSTS